MALPGQVRGGVWDEEEEEEACEGPGEAEEGRLPGLARELRRGPLVTCSTDPMAMM